MNQFYDSSSSINKKTYNYEEEIEKQQTNSPAACSYTFATSTACSALIIMLLPYLTQIIWFTFEFIINSNL